MRHFSFLATALLVTKECTSAFVTSVEKASKETSLAGAENDSDIGSRRSFLSFSASGFLGVASLSLATDEASAREELFKPNPLTNPLLEQVRIWEQAEADDIKYNGELTAGDAANRGRVDEYPKLLVPILKMSEELKTVDTLVHGGPDDWEKALKIIQQPQYEKTAFKRTFNKFADNIYYGDPDRANLYLGGGTTPRSEQSLAYLLRNDILTNLEALQAELEYLLKEKDDPGDLYKYSANTNLAMNDYLKNVSPDEMAKAKSLLASDQ